jgi:hypothetical protein
MPLAGGILLAEAIPEGLRAQIHATAASLCTPSGAAAMAVAALLYHFLFKAPARKEAFIVDESVADAFKARAPCRRGLPYSAVRSRNGA